MADLIGKEPNMQSLRNYLQHHLNPLHLYCRLRAFGIGHVRASRLCAYYERHMYPLSWLGREHKIGTV